MLYYLNQSSKFNNHYHYTFDLFLVDGSWFQKTIYWNTIYKKKPLE